MMHFLDWNFYFSPLEAKKIIINRFSKSSKKKIKLLVNSRTIFLNQKKISLSSFHFVISMLLLLLLEPSLFLFLYLYFDNVFFSLSLKFFQK